MQTPGAPSWSKIEHSGGTLCLACGICCQGVLHDHAPLDDGDRAVARRHALPIYRGDVAYTAFALPCPQHRQGRCATYADRPSVCDRYSCDLLDGWNSGRIALDDALDIVAEVKAVVARVWRRTGRSGAGERIWSAVARYSAARRDEFGEGEFARAEAPLLMDIGLLLALCSRHFERQRSSRVA